MSPCSYCESFFICLRLFTYRSPYAFQNNKNTIYHAPENKVPGSTMPQSGQEEDNNEIPVYMPPISSQRYIDIIFEPGRKRDVPPTPEFCDALGNIGQIEVFIKMKTEHTSQANRHIAVA